MPQTGRILAPAASPGAKRMHVMDLETPALIVDLDMMDRNIAAMAEATRQYGIALRPHIKTHKTPALAHRQMAAGAVGIACATLGEAEVMAAAGLSDILVTRAVVGRSKVERLCGLSRLAKMSVVTDSPDNVDELAEIAGSLGVTLDVLMEVNVGQNRCGVEPASPEALALARRIAGKKSLRFAGLQGYEGHLVLTADEQARVSATRGANTAGAETKKMLEQAGIPVPVLTGGGTGTYNVTGLAAESGYTELQPGSYATMDARYSAQMGDVPFGPALGLLTTCVSRPTADRAVVDAGQKAASFDYGAPAIKGRPGLEYVAGRGGDEHGVVLCRSEELRVGEVVELYPSHGCTTFNLHNWLYGVRGGYVEVVWNIAARGASW